MEMSQKFTPFWMLLTLVALLLTACAGAPATSGGETAYPPSILMTALPYPPEEVQAYPSPGSGGVLVGPMPFPTPQAEAVAWEKLVDQAAIADIQVQEYSGQIHGQETGLMFPFTFQYPSAWVFVPDPSPTRVSVQVVPSTPGEIREDFIRFEMFWLEESPVIPQGQVLDPDEIQTVMISGSPAVMQTATDLPGMGRNIMAFVEHEGAWYAIHGTIALPAEDYEKLEKYTDIIYSMIASVAFQ
jgi:hypothetical protein